MNARRPACRRRPARRCAGAARGAACTLTLAGLLASLLAGCASGDTPTPSAAAAPELPVADGAPGRRVVTHSGRWAVVFSARPDPVPLNEPFDLLVAVARAADGTPARPDVALAVDAGMPQHRHGMNRQPRLSRLPDGRFLVEGLLFHMAGEWTVSFDVTLDGLTERAEVVLSVP